MAKVSVLGMGAMGSRMAAALLEAGHEVMVWNRSAEKTQVLAAQGAAVADTPRAAATGAEFVIGIVRDDEASRQVWLDGEIGALAEMAGDAVAITSSTLTVAWVEELAAECDGKGIAFVDAPVVGSRPQAKARKLIYLVGDQPRTLPRLNPCYR